MTKYYYKTECYVCGKRISTSGWASVNHKRKHVREGIMEEFFRFGVSFRVVDREKVRELYPNSPLLRNDK